MTSRADVSGSLAAAAVGAPAWARLGPVERGSILRRCAELVERRSAEFAHELAAGAEDDAGARLEVRAAVERTAAYAGWAVAAYLVESAPPFVAGPYAAHTVRVPLGIVAVLAPERSALAGFASTVLPPLAAGNAVIAIVPPRGATIAVTFAECLAASGAPHGVLGVLAGDAPELAAAAAKRAEIGAYALWSNDDAVHAAVRRLAIARGADVASRREPAPDAWLADDARPLATIDAFLAAKTIARPAAV